MKAALKLEGKEKRDRRYYDAVCEFERAARALQGAFAAAVDPLAASSYDIAIAQVLATFQRTFPRPIEPKGEAELSRFTSHNPGPCPKCGAEVDAQTGLCDNCAAGN